MLKVETLTISSRPDLRWIGYPTRVRLRVVEKPKHGYIAYIHYTYIYSPGQMKASPRIGRF